MQACTRVGRRREPLVQTLEIQSGVSPNLFIPFIPVLAVLVGALVALWRRPGPAVSSAIQHFAAGVVFAAAAAEPSFPLQEASDTDAILTTSGSGSEITILAVLEQIFASTTVTVYDPADKLFCVGEVDPVVHE